MRVLVNEGSDSEEEMLMAAAAQLPRGEREKGMVGAMVEMGDTRGRP